MDSALRSGQRILGGSGPYVSIAVPIALESAVDAGDEDVVPEIELPLAVE